MILGEPDIQRQVKTAMEAAQSARTLGTRLNRLFQDALVTGKKARTETGISAGRGGGMRREGEGAQGECGGGEGGTDVHGWVSWAADRASTDLGADTGQ